MGISKVNLLALAGREAVNTVTGMLIDGTR